MRTTRRWLGIALFIAMGCDAPMDPGPMDGGRDGGAACAGQADGTSCGAGKVCMSEVCVAAAAGCGNGVVDPGEQCDDGNEASYDGCDTNCVTTCSDDAWCDDHNECTGVETCSPCEDESCATGRRCVDGTPLADSTPCALDGGETGVCRSSTCVTPQCGNGTVDAGESCDDGNTTPEDGCEVDCRFTCEAADTESTNTWYPDCDHDGYAPSGATPQMACLEPAAAGACGWTLRNPATDGADCNDGNDGIHPGASELCDEIDNDCTGGVDNACTAIPCTDPSECASGFCVDGICCDSACTGQCEACDVTPGTCSQVTGAPRGERAACAGEGTICGGTCGTTRAACDYPTAMCRSQSCTDAVVTLAASCDGAGACPAASMDACEPFACNSTGTSCRTTCSSDIDCSAGNYCNAGMCLGTKPRGYTCGSPSECTSGYCADGYCCDRACTGQCERCDAAGSLGTCSPTTGAPVGARPACASDHGTCGGSCNGVNPNACAYPTGGTCSYCTTGGLVINPNPYAYRSGTCNGAGSCTGGTSTSCGNYACAIGLSGAFCRTACTENSHCRFGYMCRDGTCQLPIIVP